MDQLPRISSDEAVVEQALTAHLEAMSPEVAVRAHALVRQLSVDDKTSVLDDFDRLPRPLRPLLARVVQRHPHVIIDLLMAFRPTVQTIYRGLRAVHFCPISKPAWQRRLYDYTYEADDDYCCGDKDEGPPPLPPLTFSDEDAVIRARGLRGCVVSGHEPSLTDVVHIVPFPLGRRRDRAASPFFRLADLLFPAAYAEHAWARAGGANVHSPANLATLAPNFRAMHGAGRIFLQPVVYGGLALAYAVRFRLPPLRMSHTRLAGNECVELRDGHLITEHVDDCGDAVLHMLVNDFCTLPGHYAFRYGERGERRDLGPFFE